MLNGTGKVFGENINGVTSLQYNDGWSVCDNRANYIDIYGDLMFEGGKLGNTASNTSDDYREIDESSK